MLRLTSSRTWRELNCFGKVRERISRLCSAGSIYRNIAVLTGGTAAGQVLVLLSAPILTRLYSPTDFGVLLVFNSLLQLVLVLTSLRYELAIPLPHQDRDAAYVAFLGLALVCGTSFMIGIGMWLAGSWLARATQTPVLARYLWLLPICLCGAGFYQVFNYWAIRQKEFTAIARTRIVQGVGSVGTQLGLGLLAAGSVGLLLGHAFGQAAGAMSLGKQFIKTHSIRSVQWGRIWTIAWDYRRFPLISSFSSLCNSAGLFLPGLILAALYGPQVAGWFALGQRVIGWPMTLLGQSVAQVFLAEAGSLAHHHPERMLVLFRHAAKNLFMVGLGLMGGVIFVGGWLFGWLFGPDWAEAGRYVQFLSIAFVFQFVAVPISHTLILIQRQDMQLAWDLCRLTAATGGLWAAFRLHLDAIGAIGLYSAITAIAYAAFILLCSRCLKGHISKHQTAHPEETSVQPCPC